MSDKKKATLYFSVDAIAFDSSAFTRLELQYMDHRLIAWMEDDSKKGPSDEQSFAARCLAYASGCVFALIQLQGRPADVHGFSVAKYSRLLSTRQLARANYYYLLWDNLNNEPTDVGSENWWEWQREQISVITVAVRKEYPDDAPELETEAINLSADDVGTVPASVIEPGTP